MEKYVVKDNALIDACFNLSLAEYRILLLAMVVAREQDPLSVFTPVEIAGLDYAQQFDLDRSTAYESLAEASKTLLKRTYSYKDTYRGKEAISDVHWLTQATYVQSTGVVVLYFTHQTISLISRLEEHFTRYHIDQVSKFKSKYSIRLYEIVIKWLDNKKTQKYSLDEFKEKMGISNEYKQMSDFKINVLDKAVNEINAYSDITIKYEQFKKGREISAFQFKIAPKKAPNAVDQTGDLFVELSTAQRHLFASKLSRHADMAKYSLGTESYDQFAVRIAEMLLDEQKFKELYPILLKVGYAPKS